MSIISDDRVSNDEYPPELLQQIAKRLRPVCDAIPNDEFMRLVHDVVRVKLKYDGDQFADLLDRVIDPPSDRKTT